MTRKRLLVHRQRAECARYFEVLGRGAATRDMIAALPRMRAMAARCGYAARADRPGHCRTHKRQSNGMRRFKTRLAFYLDFAPAECALNQMRSAFLARPAFDELNSRPLWYSLVLDEQTGQTTYGPERLVVPRGYVEWRVHGESWIIPVSRDQRERALELLRERKLRRPRPFSPHAVGARSIPVGESP